MKGQRARRLLFPSSRRGNPSPTLPHISQLGSGRTSPRPAPDDRVLYPRRDPMIRSSCCNSIPSIWVYMLQLNHIDSVYRMSRSTIHQSKGKVCRTSERDA